MNFYFRARRKKAISVDKTTSMLIIMLLIFLITELPQGKKCSGDKLSLTKWQCQNTVEN